MSFKENYPIKKSGAEKVDLMKYALPILCAMIAGCVTTYFPPNVTAPLGDAGVKPAYIGTIEWGSLITQVDGHELQMGTIASVTPGTHRLVVKVSGTDGTNSLYGFYDAALSVEAGKAYEVVALIDRGTRTVSLFANVQPASELECTTTHRVNFEYSRVKEESLKRCGHRKDTGYGFPESRLNHMKTVPIAISKCAGSAKALSIAPQGATCG